MVRRLNKWIQFTYILKGFHLKGLCYISQIFASKCRMCHHKGLKKNDLNEVLICANNANLLGKNVNTIMQKFSYRSLKIVV